MKTAMNRVGLALLALALTTATVQAIDPPADPRGTVISADTIKWEWASVPGANQYQVNVNGEFIDLVSDLSYTQSSLPNGTYSMTVQAVSGDNRYSSPSATSESRTIGDGIKSNQPSNVAVINRSTNNDFSSTSSISAPGDPRGTLVGAGEIKWEWSSVFEAQRYEVFVDNASAGFTNDTFMYSQNLSAGEHFMQVRSIDSNGNHSGISAQAIRSVIDGIASTNNNDSSNSNATTRNVAAVAPVPPSNPRGTRTRAGQIKWEWTPVPGAVQYEVIVDGNYQPLTSDLFYYSSNLYVGEHRMKVKSVNSIGQFSSESVEAKATTWENGDGSTSITQSTTVQSTTDILPPQDVRGTQILPQEVKWEWATAIGAVDYAVYLDGQLAGTTGNDYLYTGNLSNGDHSVSVAAIDGQGRYSERSASVTVNVSDDNAASASTQVAPPPPQASGDDNGPIDPTSWNIPEVYEKDGYELAFSDEFNHSELNPNRWNTQLRWDGQWNGERYEYRIINGESQFYVNIYSPDFEHLSEVAPVYNPFEFDGNRLAIRAVRNPLDTHSDGLSFGELSRISSQQPFLSGVISTYNKFSQKYGYFEARIKIPAHVGTFPAFWLHHQKQEWEGTQKTEIDIMENLGHAPHYVYNSFHYFTDVYPGVFGTPHSIKPSPQGQISNGSNYSDDYHVYAVEWSPSHIRYLIDGQQVSEVRNEASDYEELYIILNLAVGGIWTNLPTNAGGTGREGNQRFPTQADIDAWQDPALEIDYVRVYKKR